VAHGRQSYLAPELLEFDLRFVSLNPLK
jgi:hypothetical protein